MEGMGDNAGVSENMGMMSHSMPISVPGGHAAVTPSLSFDYSSGNGNSLLGVGWMLHTSSIERLSLRGLPEYTAEDEFAANGSAQLVQTYAQPTYREYRERFEGAFIRYRWYDQQSNGAKGYWTAAYPDGSIGYFGADATGTAVSSARSDHTEKGTFRYYLVEVVDVYGHRLKYYYTKQDGIPLPFQIDYVFNANGEPKNQIRFFYEDREDHISDCKPGFNELLTKRLKRVMVQASGIVIGDYRLSYEDYEKSGGLSRISSIETFGRNMEAHALVHRFGYSRALGSDCEEEDCGQPYLENLGQTGAQVASGKALLIDMNGDALPDIVDGSGCDSGQPHSFFFSQLTQDENGDFSHGFSESLDSAIQDSSGFQIGSPYVQPLDLNGDGFTDLVSTRTASALINKGNGDWEETLAAGTDALPDFDPDENGEAETIRFFDYNSDRLIDIMKVTGNSTIVYRNTGYDFSVDEQVAQIEQVIATKMQFADMNGDGLLDPTTLYVGGLSYQLNLGWGQWSEKQDIKGLPLDANDVNNATLEDLNGDGVDDLVVVVGKVVKYALNRNGDRFAPVKTISEAQGVSIPERDGQTTVLFADMNGNGSDDVVWIKNGNMHYLELFPVRPNLLDRIENSLGSITQVTYGSSVEQMARDENADPAIHWEHPLPHPMTVVTHVDKWDELTHVHEVVEYKYHNGFYDGAEKDFRGYTEVETVLEGDDFQESGWTRSHYEVGVEDTYRHGLLLSSEAESNGEPLSSQAYAYGDCPVAGLPEVALRFDVRFICQISSEHIAKERQPEDQYVTLFEEQAYDGYGNVTSSITHGVTKIGTGGCAGTWDGEFGAPKGPECLGDEVYEETRYIDPGPDTGDQWILGTPSRSLQYGAIDSDNYRETIYYYDGDPFVGLPEGELTKGDLTRTNIRVTANRWVDEQRSRFDVHGNPMEILDPLGDPNSTTHRHKYTYAPDGLNVLRTEVFLEDATGPYALQREYRYDEAWGKPIAATDWMLVRNPESANPVVISSPNSRFFTYDNFGRTASIVHPGGDTLALPSQEMVYELGTPVSRIIARSRSRVGSPMDMEHITCVDGRGRTFQERTRLSDGAYQVTGFTLFNIRGSEFRVYQPYSSDSPECDLVPPEGTLYTQFHRDASYRTLEVEAPDQDIYGTASVARTEYGPLWTKRFDAEDNVDAGTFPNTPMIHHTDGLGRVTAIERTKIDAVSAVTEIFYDSLGNMRGYRDAAGSEKLQAFDFLGRVTRVDDPNSGTTTYAYDDAGNLVTVHDARNKVVHTVYDGAGRPIARWDEDDQAGTQVSWTYDTPPSDLANVCKGSEGNLVEVSYPLDPREPTKRGRDYLSYDSRGRVTNMWRSIGYDFVFEIENTYDNAGRLLASVYPDGRVIQRKYDDAGRLVAIDGIIDDIAYTPRGLMGRATQHNQTETVYSHDSIMRLEVLETLDHRGKVLQGYVYDRLRTGQISDIMDVAIARPNHPDSTATFTYDEWYRVTGSAYGPSASTTESLGFQFDNIDSILSATSDLSQSPVHLGQYTYGQEAGPNAVTRAGALSYKYDPAGYMVERGSVAFDWDAWGRLTTATQNGEVIAEFTYGPDQNRVVKKEGNFKTTYVARDFEVRDGIAVYYARLGRDRIARFETPALATKLLSDLAVVNTHPDNEINAADAWLSHAAAEHYISLETGHTASPPGELLTATVRGMLLKTSQTYAPLAKEAVTYLHHDHLGSITMATDGQGTPIAERTYYPFGQLKDQYGYVDEYGFTGQERDSATGLDHYQYRYLDTNVGRWVSTDPLFRVSTPGLINKIGESTTAYAYVANNYVNCMDPDGTQKGGKKGGKNHKTPLSIQKRKRTKPGTHGNKKNEQRRLTRPWARVSGQTHESEHTIGYAVLAPNLPRGQSTEARQIENDAPAYQEVRDMHREHIGTGTRSMPDSTGQNSQTYRTSQRRLLESGDVSSAVQLNQLGYAAVRPQLTVGTIELAQANNSFDRMVENLHSVEHNAGVANVTPIEQAEMYLSRRAALTGQWPGQRDIDAAIAKFEPMEIE